MEAKKRKYSKLYCPHCDKEVSKSTWYKHYSRFFNATTNQWIKQYSNNNDFDFQSAESQQETDYTTHEAGLDHDQELPESLGLNTDLDLLADTDVSSYKHMHIASSEYIIGMCRLSNIACNYLSYHPQCYIKLYFNR